MRAGIILKWLITLGLLALVVRFVDGAELLRALQPAKPLPYLLSTLAFLASFVVLALRLHALLQPTKLSDLRWGSLLRIHVSSMFYGFFVPSDLGTAAIRWYRVTGNRRGRSEFVMITLLERLMTTFTTLLFAVVALSFSPNASIAGFRNDALPLLWPICLLVGAVVLIFSSRKLHDWGGSMLRWVEKRSQRDWVKKMFSVYWNIERYHDQPKALGNAYAWQLLFQLLLVARFILLFQCLEIEIPVVDAVWVSMLVMFLTLMPLTIAGLGVREGGFAAAFALFHVSAETGVLVGLLAFSQIVVVLLWGGLATLLERGHTNAV